MIYKSADDWIASPTRRIALFGMSGLGKTHVSSLLRASGGWFHYSVDYRIGTRYMGEHIADSFKAEAMRVPYLRELLLSDSIYIASNITFSNLAPLSKYLGKPGDPATEEFWFCGLQTAPGKPYCDAHVAVAFQPMSSRRDRRSSGR